MVCVPSVLEIKTPGNTFFIGWSQSLLLEKIHSFVKKEYQVHCNEIRCTVQFFVSNEHVVINFAKVYSLTLCMDVLINES